MNSPDLLSWGCNFKVLYILKVLFCERLPTGLLVYRKNIFTSYTVSLLLVSSMSIVSWLSEDGKSWMLGCLGENGDIQCISLTLNTISVGVGWGGGGVVGDGAWWWWWGVVRGYGTYVLCDWVK